MSTESIITAFATVTLVFAMGYYYYITHTTHRPH